MTGLCGHNAPLTAQRSADFKGSQTRQVTIHVVLYPRNHNAAPARRGGRYVEGGGGDGAAAGGGGGAGRALYIYIYIYIH